MLWLIPVNAALARVTSLLTYATWKFPEMMSGLQQVRESGLDTGSFRDPAAAFTAAWTVDPARCHGNQPLLVLRLVRFWSIEERAPQAVASLPNGLCCAFSTTGSVLAAG